MEKETRMNKYRELRQAISDGENEENIKVEIDEAHDDDFLDFLKDEKASHDEELTALTYDSLEEDEIVKTAINEAKLNVGKIQYNTRMDILAKLKNQEPEITEEESEIEEQGLDITKVDMNNEVEEPVEEEKEEVYQSTDKHVSVYGIKEDVEEEVKEEEEEENREEIDEKEAGIEEKKEKHFISTIIDVIIFILIVALIVVGYSFIRALI